MVVKNSSSKSSVLEFKKKKKVFLFLVFSGVTDSLHPERLFKKKKEERKKLKFCIYDPCSRPW